MATVRAVLQAARARLAEASTSPALDAQLLLCDVLGVENRAYLFTHPERELTAEESDAYDALVARRVSGEPVAYIRGFRAWYDRDILVTPDVLIPRPETELLLETALEQTTTDVVAADIGTGSGALAVTFAAHRPAATVYATDISPAALSVARHNADVNNAQVTFLQGNLLAPLIEHKIRVGLLMSNPPYIQTSVMRQLEVSRFEPHLALDGGADGLDLVRQLLHDAPRVCLPGAYILVEIGADQAEAVLAMAHALLTPANAEVRKDYAGLDRFLVATLAN